MRQRSEQVAVTATQRLSSAALDVRHAVGRSRHASIGGVQISANTAVQMNGWLQTCTSRMYEARGQSVQGCLAGSPAVAKPGRQCCAEWRRAAQTTKFQRNTAQAPAMLRRILLAVAETLQLLGTVSAGRRGIHRLQLLQHHTSADTAHTTHCKNIRWEEEGE